MRLKIRTYVLSCFAAMLGMLICVAAIAIDSTERIGIIAGELNSRVVAKTRIANAILELGQQIRFADAFMLRSSDPEQDALAASAIQDRTDALVAKTESYLPFVDSDLERSLLKNLTRSRSAYLDLQAQIGGTPSASRLANAASNEAQLAAAFDKANRQARGLALLAESEARGARARAVDIVAGAWVMVIAVSVLAFATGLLMLVVLRDRIFRPLTRITGALVSLAKGDLGVALEATGRGDEIDAMAQALDVFRKNAIALGEAHEQTKSAHQRAESLARHDALTGLPNRRVLSEAIEEAIGRSKRRGAGCAVVVLDLDRFKPVNDIYGHGAGDRVLCKVADRLKAIVRAGERVARLGGDEFAVVLEFELGGDAPLRFAKRAIETIGAEMDLDGRTVSVGTSIGIALWPADGVDAESLLHSADLAMFKVKRDQRGNFRFFEPEMDMALRARADLEARLRRAITDGDIRPHYQTLVDLRNNAITGFEILARWQDGDKLRPPSDFIQIADDAGLIPDLTYSVLRQACRDSRRWPEDLSLALNVTPGQLSDARFPKALFALLAEEQFSPLRLELEITENALIGDISAAKLVIADLRANGVRISLDDFGTGYSSLHHLRDLKIDKIKIDQSFVRSMLDNTESIKIIETVLSLGRSLGIDTIAEGIEDGEHLSSLLAHGCEFGQGYLFSKPQSADAIYKMLITGMPAAQAA